MTEIASPRRLSSPNAFLVPFLYLLIISTACSKCHSQKRQEISVLPTPAPGTRKLITRKYAKIPDFNGEPSRIVGMTSWKGNLYVCASVSGGVIHRVDRKGKVTPWFDVQSAMRALSRNVEMNNNYHGGIRSIAFHPKHDKNGLFYVSLLERRNGPASNYKFLSKPADPTDADSVVYEWRVNLATGVPIGTSMRQVFRVGLLNYDHPVKQMKFKGNLLYVGHGDGSVQSAIVGGGLNNDALGKIIRINPLKKNGKPYTIPLSNPYVKNKAYLSELFAIGFRNPHTLCFSKLKGDLFVGDTGRDNVEEINIVKGGRSYGWPAREGAFVHLKRGGGLGDGVANLPGNDAKYGFTYPNAVIGHNGVRGWSFQQAGQAIASSCPVENGSDLNGLLLYGNFPTDGAIFYSRVNSLRKAVVKGPPKKLQTAKSFRIKIFYDHDSNEGTEPIPVDDLRDIIRMEDGKSRESRVDFRFGQGSKGELFWSSKTSGSIYLVTNSVPKMTLR